MVYTEYDERRDYLRTLLEEALEYAREYILNSDIWGYSHMRSDYAIDVYRAIKDALDEV